MYLFCNSHILLYRAVSKEEWKDYQKHKVFRTAKNTLEAKQFFKTEIAVASYKRKAHERKFRPPYIYILVLDIDEECLNFISFEEQILDDFEAISINEPELAAFNDCVNFVKLDDI